MKKFGLLFSLIAFNSYAGYVAHEWGTFTSLMGSDGQRQNGMYHEDELLPSFVHRFGEDFRLKKDFKNLVATSNGCRRSKVCDEYVQGQSITQKMETPVLYFYSDTNEKVSVEVGFPEGIIAESFPKYDVNTPQASPGVQLKNGRALYNIEILSDKNAPIPYVEAGNIYTHARNVESNIIKNADNEYEKFIFYRGLGDFKTNLSVVSDDFKLTIQNNGELIKHAFILNSKNGKGSIYSIGEIESGADKKLTLTNEEIERLKNYPRSDFIKDSRHLLINALVTEGLKTDEAQAMIDTWEQSYLKTDGLRILYVLNASEVERILPMKLTPGPSDLKRVFIGRIEVLTKKEEERLMNLVQDSKGKFKVQTLGRMAHPIANRLLEIAKARKYSIAQRLPFENLVQEALTN